MQELFPGTNEALNNLSLYKENEVKFEDVDAFEIAMEHFDDLKAELGYDITRNYCKCTADHFDKNYDDASLLNLVQGEGGSAYNDVVNFVINKCRRLVGLG